MTQLDLPFRRYRGQHRGEADAAMLRGLMSDGQTRTRRQIAAELGWSERDVRDCAEAIGGEISRAPGVDGYRLTAGVPVEEWQESYGRAWRAYIRNLARQYAAQMRVLYRGRTQEK